MTAAFIVPSPDRSHSTSETADVVVIGGGLAGCATAYYLARDGVDVLLVDQSDLNTFASGANAGSLHAQIPHDPFVNKGEAWARTFAPTVALLAHSIEMWKSLGAELQTNDLEVSLRGGLLVAANETEMEQIRRKVEFERAQGLTVDIVGQNALRDLAPYLADTLIGGAFCPDEGKANPLAATPAFARAAHRHGARLQSQRPVRAIEATAAGFSIATDRGPIRARRVVNAGGSDAGRIAAMVGKALLVESHPIQVSVTERVAPLIPHLVYSAGEKLTLKQNAAGSLLIGGGWPARLGPCGRPVVDPISLMRNLGVARQAMPGLADISIVRSWAAIVNGTEDWKPMLGELPGLPGFFVSFFPWMGFTAGPIVGRITASLVQGEAPPLDFDLSPFLLG